MDHGTQRALDLAAEVSQKLAMLLVMVFFLSIMVAACYCMLSQQIQELKKRLFEDEDDGEGDQ